MSTKGDKVFKICLLTKKIQQKFSKKIGLAKISAQNVQQKERQCEGKKMRSSDHLRGCLV
jgi:hypothetical protein